MDVNSERLLNIKLPSRPEFKLILDDVTPKNPKTEAAVLRDELLQRLELVSEDRERLKKLFVNMQKEKKALINDVKHRKVLHEELMQWFARKNEKILRELEMEEKVLTEVFARKAALLGKMRGLLHQAPKENTLRDTCRKRIFDFESNPLKKLELKDSLSPVKRINTARHQKIAVFRNSLCN